MDRAGTVYEVSCPGSHRGSVRDGIYENVGSLLLNRHYPSDSVKDAVLYFVGEFLNDWRPANPK